MAQVSKRKINNKIESKMYETLWQAFSQLSYKGDIQLFLNDILSPTEKIMIAKRLAIASLLSRNYDYETIKNLIKVSQGTVAKIVLSLKFRNGYKIAIDKIARSEAAKDFWQDIENLLYRLGNPRITLASDRFIRKKLGLKKGTLI